jgi:hypothetical protein
MILYISNELTIQNLEEIWKLNKFVQFLNGLLALTSYSKEIFSLCVKWSSLVDNSKTGLSCIRIPPVQIH